MQYVVIKLCIHKKEHHHKKYVVITLLRGDKFYLSIEQNLPLDLSGVNWQYSQHRNKAVTKWM